MKKKRLFYGAATALITPFSGDTVDKDALMRLVEFQLSEGIETLIFGGTTGEAATLTDKERYSLFYFLRERIEKRARLIYGTGTNDTRLALLHTREAKAAGADGALVVTPYYNKGTSEGILRHYLTIEEGADLPLILYNVPQRTGVCLEIKTLERLSKEENIVGIKEASDSCERLVTLATYGEALPLYAGNDSAVYSVLSLGGAGVISVASNFLPKTVSSICKDYALGRREGALKTQLALLPFISSLFIETNPAPIKYLLSEKRDGFLAPEMPSELRLPLSEVKPETKNAIKSELLRLKEAGILSS